MHCKSFGVKNNKKGFALLQIPKGILHVKNRAGFLTRPIARLLLELEAKRETVHIIQQVE